MNGIDTTFNQYFLALYETQITETIPVPMRLIAEDGSPLITEDGDQYITE